MGDKLRTPTRSILLRVLGGVMAAGMLALALSTTAILHIVGADKEAGLADGAVLRARRAADSVDEDVELARAELRSVGLAATDHRFMALPDLVSSSVVAFRCLRGGHTLVQASTTSEGQRLLERSTAPAPGHVRLVGGHYVLVAERVDDATVHGLVDVSPALSVPSGWHAELTDASHASAAVRTGAVVAQRQPDSSGGRVRAEAMSDAGLLVVLHAPLAPARRAAVHISTQVVLWSLGALLPLAFVAWLLGRALTSPVRRLAKAVRDAGNGPITLPPLSHDEIGALGHAIGNMSDRLHADQRALERAVAFARQVARLRHRAEVLRALEDALREAFPTIRWYAVGIEAVREGQLPQEVDGETEHVLAAISNGRSELPAERSSGDGERWAGSQPIPNGRDLLILPLRTSRQAYGVLIGAPAVRDDLAIRHAELLARVSLAALQSIELLQAAVANEKLAALGRLAATVAHEMNNPLAFVLVNARVLEEELDGELADAARDVREGADRLSRIVHDLSSLSKGGHQIEPADHDLGEIVRSTVKIARVRHPRVAVELHEQTGGHVPCDRGRIEQVLLNLVANASDAADQGDQPRVVIRSRVEEDRVVIDVEDNGSGVAPQVRERLFEPFFTTKGGAGTGLGLYLSRSLAKAHGGSLDLVATGPEGSVFRLTLPGAGPEPREAASSTRPQDGGVIRTRVLVVDDEAAIVRSLQRWIGRRAEVVGTTSAMEALELAAKDHFDLVLCDVDMPEMSGLDLAATLGRDRPAMAERIVLMSGADGEPPCGYSVMRKPLEATDLQDLLDLAERRSIHDEMLVC